MKGILLFLLLSTSVLHAQKHNYTLQTLVEYVSVHPDQFDAFVSKKGFKFMELDTLSNVQSAYHKLSKDKTMERMMKRADNGDTASLIFFTTVQTEFAEIKQELEKNQFFYPEGLKVQPPQYPDYQKGNLTVIPGVMKQEDKTWYTFKIKKHHLPAANNIMHAEDLLQLNSHESIVAVFGSQNVKKDVFYFSEKEISKCSILFPNTSVQVIFLWEDEINIKNIAFLILGGQTRNQGKTIYNGNEFHKWRSSQGVSLGMSLKELQELNGVDIDFYGWETEQPGHVTSVNTGKIDLSTIGIQLDCLDCYGDTYYSKSPVINSKNIIKTNSRALVSTMIILPKKQKKAELIVTKN
jgi:hypothetical protein